MEVNNNQIKPSSTSDADIMAWKELSKLLKCPICCGFFQTAMMFTTCSHNYCSSCIRRSLSFKEECPTCRKQASTVDLRNNRRLDELVQNFVSCKTVVKKLLHNQGQDNLIVGNTSLSQREVAQSEGQEIEIGVDSPPAVQSNEKKESPTTTNHKKRKTPAQKNQSPNHSFTSRKKRKSPSSSSLSSFMASSNEEGNSQTVSKSKGLVQCPVCGISLSERFINAHLDTCLGTTSGRENFFVKNNAQNQKLKNASKPRKRIAKVFYNGLQLSKLRNMLKECGLATTGDRTTLIKRHKAYVTMYNAECDSLNPRSSRSIARTVSEQERATSSEIVFSKQDLAPQQDLFSKLEADIRNRIKKRLSETNSDVPISSPKPTTSCRNLDSSHDKEKKILRNSTASKPIQSEANGSSTSSTTPMATSGKRVVSPHWSNKHQPSNSKNHSTLSTPNTNPSSSKRDVNNLPTNPSPSTPIYSRYPNKPPVSYDSPSTPVYSSQDNHLTPSQRFSLRPSAGFSQRVRELSRKAAAEPLFPDLPDVWIPDDPSKQQLAVDSDMDLSIATTPTTTRTRTPNLRQPKNRSSSHELNTAKTSNGSIGKVPARLKGNPSQPRAKGKSDKTETASSRNGKEASRSVTRSSQDSSQETKRTNNRSSNPSQETTHATRSSQDSSQEKRMRRSSRVIQRPNYQF